MHSAQKLVRVLRDLVVLCEEEAACNPAFAERLESITAELPANKKRSGEKRSKAQPLPDIFAALKEKGEDEFRFWLRSHDLATLKATVKANGFDPGKNSQRWNEPDKFVALIVEQATARLRRGSAFLPPRSPSEEEGG